MKLTKSLFGCLIMITSIFISSCSGGVKDKDGNIYNTVKIGTQVWMVENLNVSRFRNGDTITGVRTADEWELMGKEGKPAWCIQQNDPDYGKKYGKLYNWYAVNDPRGLAPDGWHVPTDDEWTLLINNLGGEAFAAIKMRTTGFTESGNGTNKSAFMGLPAGACTNAGSFFGFGSTSCWWSSTEFTSTNAWTRLLNYMYCFLNSKPYSKNYGLSVRCLKD